MNEFKILELIGKGAFSKVKRVVREYDEGGQHFEDVYAMKVKLFSIRSIDDAQTHFVPREGHSIR